MKETLLQFFQDYPDLALFTSLGVSILVAVLGFLPSLFITAANLFFFGFWKGTVLSFAGESIGALLAFLLYRKGFREVSAASFQRFPRLRILLEAKGKRAVLLVIAFRLLPLVPSGLVTFAAAIGRIGTFPFFLSSSLGKIPALLLEAYSVYQVTRLTWQGKILLVMASLAMLFWFIKSSSGRRSRRQRGPAEPKSD
jgi:uncharacterized membrane protein YdjX (TVP38/TMEM64 family)